MNMSPSAAAIHSLSMQITPGCWPTGYRNVEHGVAAVVLNRRSC